MTEELRSRQSAPIRFLRELARDAEARRENGLYLCDGEKLLQEALRSNAEICHVAWREKRTDGYGAFEKEYLAVVHGETPERGELRDLLRRDKARKMTFVADAPGKGVQEAVLDYETIARGQGMSLVRIRLHTGRTHQIRVQFASRGFPLFGERKYCGEPDDCLLALWSHTVGFTHPATGERLRFVKEPPAVFPWNACEETDRQKMHDDLKKRQ